MIHVDIARFVAEIVPDLTYSEAAGGNVFIDLLPSAPDRCVAVIATGGAEADSKLPYDPVNVQIVVRGDTNPTWALTTWGTIYSQLHGKRNVVMPGGAYLVFALVVQASPVRLGPDDNGRHRYTMNVRTEIHNPTEERP